MHRFAVLALLVAALGIGGCASQADLIAQERRLSKQMGDHGRQIQSIQREIERLRGDVEGGPRPTSEAAKSMDQRIQDLEDRLARLEGTAPAGDQTGADRGPREGAPGGAPVPPPRETTPPPPPPPPPPVGDDTWSRDVARDQQAMAATNAPEREALAPMMEAVARKDCGKAVGQLNTFAAQNKQSPLASHALYWVARCHAQRGDRNQAISKFYDVVTKYPKGAKAPAALWEQGNLFIEMGDSPDARVTLGKLIKDYPSSDEASRARKRLTELDR